MSDSTKILGGIIGTLIVLAGVFYIGMVYEKSRFVDTPVVVHQEINTDSLHNVWLNALPKTLDSTEYKKVLDELNALRGRSAQIKWVHDTIPGAPVYVYASTDTVIPTIVHSVTMDEEDTVKTSQAATVSMGIDYFPDLNAFRIRNLAISNLKQTFTRKRSIVTEKGIDLGISTDFVMGFDGGLVGGGFLNFDHLGVGGIFAEGRQPIWAAKINVPINTLGHP
jgi:hypothetical protein